MSMLPDSSPLGHSSQGEDDAVTLRPKATPTVYQNETFVENQFGINDHLEYERKGNDPGLVVIFNQIICEGYEPRYGTEKDLSELIITFRRLKYNMDSRFICVNYTTEQIEKKIAEICKMDLRQRNSLICIYMSHGEEKNTLVTANGKMKVEKIYEPFAKCEHLKGKPKIFLFQACKAQKLKTTEEELTDGIKLKQLVSDRTLKDHIPNDVLLAYSTLEGEVAFRNQKHGSWFIQEVCRNFYAYGRRDDVASIIFRVTKCVAHSYIYEERGVKAKQLPIVLSTLRKKFYLTRSKERMDLLQIMQEQKEIKTALLNLHKQVNEIRKSKNK